MPKVRKTPRVVIKREEEEEAELYASPSPHIKQEEDTEHDVTQLVPSFERESRPYGSSAICGQYARHSMRDGADTITGKGKRGTYAFSMGSKHARFDMRGGSIRFDPYKRPEPKTASSERHPESKALPMIGPLLEAPSSDHDIIWDIRNILHREYSYASRIDAPIYVFVHGEFVKMAFSRQLDPCIRELNHRDKREDSTAISSSYVFGSNVIAMIIHHLKTRQRYRLHCDCSLDTLDGVKIHGGLFKTNFDDILSLIRKLEIKADDWIQHPSYRGQFKLKAHAILRLQEFCEHYLEDSRG